MRRPVDAVGGAGKMAKFGRFEFGKETPTEVYDGGDFMELDGKDFVRIFRGIPGWELLAPPQLINAIHLDRSQSVRQISELAK
jgi:hypothetical protein